MNVLHLISSGGMYGAEAVILQLSAEMDAGKHGTSVLGVFCHGGQTPDLYTAAKAASIPSELLPCRGQLDLAVPGAIARLAKRLNVQVVHAHGYKADLYAFLAFRGGRGPALVSTCHTWYDNDVAVRVYGLLDRWVLRHFDEVVAVSAEVQNRLIRAGVRSERVSIIPNGVKVPPLQQHTSRSSDNETSERIRVGLVGRLAPEKGIDLYLRAIALIAHQHPEVDFVVAGDGPDRLSLETLLQELHLGDRVRFMGQQTDMHAFYATLNLLVSASRQEGLPMAILEGMAHGLPVVATSVGELPTVVVDGQTGLLVDAGWPGALADAMSRLLVDAALRERFGEAGRCRVSETFSATRMTQEYLAVYRRALASRPEMSGARTGSDLA